MVPPITPSVLVLNKTEWDRLKKAAEPRKSLSVEKSEYLQKLNERSRDWMRTWPDSIEGVVAEVTKVREKKRQRKREMVVKYKAIERLKALIDYEAVEKAKQLIFNNSCYGKQLISALVESKVIEEREAQLEFNKNRKEEALKISKKEESMNTLQVGLDDEGKTHRRKEVDKKLAEEYKAIVEENKKKLAGEREKEKLGELEDARLIKQLLDTETHDMYDCKRKAIKAAKGHVLDQQHYKKLKEIRDKEDNALVHVWKNYQERVRCREQKVKDKIHKARDDIPNLKLTYELVEQLNDKEQKRYDEFVQKGIEKFEIRSVEKDQKDAVKQNQIREQLLQYSKDNKRYADLIKSCQSNKTLYSERQTLAMKKTYDSKYGKKNVGINKEASKSSLKQNNKVLKQLRECEKEQKPCKCNCNVECPALQTSFVSSFKSTKANHTSSKNSLEASIKSQKSLKMLSKESKDGTPPSSLNYLDTITTSLKSINDASPSHKFMKLMPSTHETLELSPSSLRAKSREVGILNLSNSCEKSKHKTTDNFFKELNEYVTSNSERNNLDMENSLESTSKMKSLGIKEEAIPSFLKPRNKLIEALKKREKEPSPWTGLKGTHEYFAKQASGILKECRYKKMAQKVVNEYKKVNRLDTLPIYNWN